MSAARAFVLALVFVLLTAAIPCQALGDTLLGSSYVPGRVSSYGGVTAWDAGSLERRELPSITYAVSRRIDVLTDGGVQGLPIADGARHVDVGPGPDGTPVAVYARCPYADLGSVIGSPTYWLNSRGTAPPPSGCDIWLYDFAKGVERRLGGVSTSGASEYLPTVWGDQVAFVRAYERRKGRAGVLPYIYVRRLDGRGGSRRVPSGPRGLHEFDARTGELTFGGAGPVGLDLRGDVSAWTWEWSPTRSRTIAELRVARLGGRARVVERAQTTGLTSKNHGRLDDASVTGLTAPVLYGGSVLFARWRPGHGGAYVRRTLGSNRRLTRRVARSDWAPTSIAYDGSFAYTTRDGQLRTCSSLGSERPNLCHIWRSSAALAYP